MQDKVGFIKVTVIGGVFFLIPLAIVFVLVGKLVGVMRGVANSLSPLLAMDTPIGTIVLNLLALLVILGFCFLAGLAAQGVTAKKIVGKLDATLLAALPGYAFVKGFADNMRRNDEMSESFLPVAVHFDDYSQLAFEIEREPNGKVALYLPSAPNPWSGTVVYVTDDRVNRLSMSLNEALKNIRMLGKGSSAIVERQRSKED
ncbi:MAG: hypothetical protein VST67_01015 [Nitrospirota bacterium]|nr:hypothetical protein [Nitrospirota bacterium]